MRNLLIGGGLVLLWVIVFIITALTKSVMFEVFLPIIGLVFIGFLLYITIKLLSNLDEPSSFSDEVNKEKKS